MTKHLSELCSQLGKARNRQAKLLQENDRVTKRAFGHIVTPLVLAQLKVLTRDFGFSIAAGELQMINCNWYVTHTGLLRLARRKRCRGIHVEAVDSLCDPAVGRFVLRATVYPCKDSAGFVGYGDADPSNVSPMVQRAGMRIAKTPAVDLALPSLLILFPLRFAFLAWCPQTIGVLPDLCQGAIEKELNLLIRRAVLPFRGSRVWANSSELNSYSGGDIPKLWEESLRIQNRVHVGSHRKAVYSDLALFHLALAAFLAISLRSSGVVPSHLAFPPIFPPSLPKRANSARTPLGRRRRFLALRMSSSLAVQDAPTQAVDNMLN